MILKNCVRILVLRRHLRYLLCGVIALTVVLVVTDSYKSSDSSSSSARRGKRKGLKGALYVRKLAEMRAAADRPFLAADKENQIWWKAKHMNVSADKLFEDYNVAPNVMVEPLKQEYVDYKVGSKFLYTYDHEDTEYPEEISIDTMDRKLFIRGASGSKASRYQRKITKDVKLQASKYKHSLYVEATSSELGTQMFQYAALYSLSRMNKRIPVAAGHFTVWDVFRGTTMIKGQDVPQNTTLLKETGPGIYTDALTTPPEVHVQICCQLQSFKYWSEYTRSVARQFRFHTEMVSQADGLLRSYGKQQLARFSNMTYNQRLDLYGKYPPKETNQFNYIAVHVYVEDLLSPSQVKKGYKVAPPSYLRKAMDFFRNEYKHAMFVVFSSPQDSAWCRENVNTSFNDVVFAHNSSQGLQLATMVQCNHTITTLGPLSWWAGWLNKGRTVYFTDWIKEGSPLETEYRNKDYFPMSWFGMGA